MATLNEIIYNVRNIAGKGKSTRISDFSDRNIAYWAKYVRNELLYKTLKSNKDIGKQFEQDFGCLPLEIVDAANCTEIKWGENLKMITIPKLLDLPNNGGLTFFGLVDKITNIHVSMYDDSLDSFSPYKRKGVRANIIGQNVYVRGNNELCYVNVRGIADDPTIVNVCGSGGEVACYNPDTDCYPIPSHLEKTMYDMIFEHVFPITSKVSQNAENNEAPSNTIL